jgi:YebC/PmpR family DNA-binding regulatory protein
MSGHSKWSTIKHKKAATDQKRGKLFSKLSRAIIVAAKEGGGDPAANNSLATAIEKARSYSMPKDNIERAIARGAGSDQSEAYETVVYEGYGPSGAGFVIEALTDNRNRTAANVRAAFNKAGGALGQSGSVAYLFDRKGVLLVEGDVDEDSLTLVAADGDAEDVANEDGMWSITCEPTALARCRDAIVAGGFAVSSAEIQMIPKTLATVDEETGRKLLRLVDALEDDDDVQDVWFTFDVPESLLED